MRLGSGRATSDVSMIVFAIPFLGDFLVVSGVRVRMQLLND